MSTAASSAAGARRDIGRSFECHRDVGRRRPHGLDGSYPCSSAARRQIPEVCENSQRASRTVSGAAPRPSAPGRPRSGTAGPTGGPSRRRARRRPRRGRPTAAAWPRPGPGGRRRAGRRARGPRRHPPRRARTTCVTSPCSRASCGVDRAAGEEPVGCRARAEPGPQRDGDDRGRQAEPHLGEGEGDVVAAHDDVGGRHQRPGPRRAPGRRGGRRPAPAGRRWPAGGR